TSFMYQGSFNHSACKNSSFSIGFLLYFNILYTKIKFYLIDLRKSHFSSNIYNLLIIIINYIILKK
ncbi:MAG: hypothetical protein Q9M94_03710, partial [Candidatus Gracilibacteria bacterium]|nr:hypothetical protein [Candidatus Gracilibacteria bacterium]